MIGLHVILHITPVALVQKIYTIEVIMRECIFEHNG